MTDRPRVMVIAPHPDDETLGCGGSIALHARAGRPVTAVTVVAREPNADEPDQGVYASEFRKAAEILQLQRVMQLDLPSRGLRTDRALLDALVGAIRESAPDILYVPHRGESDREHRLVASTASEATWMASSPYSPELGDPIDPPQVVLAYEVWTPLQSVDYYEIIDKTIDVKLEAIRAYASQVRTRDYAAAFEGLAAFRGAMGGAGRHAEAFRLVRMGPGSLFHDEHSPI